MYAVGDGTAAASGLCSVGYKATLSPGSAEKKTDPRSPDYSLGGIQGHAESGVCGKKAPDPRSPDCSMLTMDPLGLCCTRQL